MSSVENDSNRSALQDRLRRPLTDLRISVTDRCNFRCAFCMPREEHYDFLPHTEVLTYEEVARVAKICVGLGVRKLRLTGGEPLLRRDIDRLVAMLAEIPGVEDLAMTTNGALLAARSEQLAQAGLGRVTVSLPSLEQDTFARLNGGRGKVADVLEGIEAAAAAGLTPVKVNAVVVRGVNDHEVPELARRFQRTGFVMRFIEYMDVGSLNHWQSAAVYSAREIVDAISKEMPLEPLPRRQTSDVARRYRYRQGDGEVGVIASITEPFCGDCSRARLTAAGDLYTCLFAAHGHDLKTPLRSGEDDVALAGRIADIWGRRQDRYSEERSERLGATGSATEPRVEMFRIGG